MTNKEWLQSVVSRLTEWLQSEDIAIDEVNIDEAFDLKVLPSAPQGFRRRAHTGRQTLSLTVTVSSREGYERYMTQVAEAAVGTSA